MNIKRNYKSRTKKVGVNMLKITREGADLIDSGLIDKRVLKLKVPSWNKQYRTIKRHFRYSLLDNTTKAEAVVFSVLLSIFFGLVLCAIIGSTGLQYLPSWFRIPMHILFSISLGWHFTTEVIIFDDGIIGNEKVFLPKVKLQIEEDIVDLTLYEKEVLLTKFAQGVFGIKRNKDNKFTILRHDNGKVSECNRDSHYCNKEIFEQMAVDKWYSITDLVYDKAKIND